MAELTRLKKQRGHIQATITNLKRVLDTANNDISQRNVHFLKASTESVKNAFRKFDSIQSKIEELDEKEIESRIAYEQNHNFELARALSMIEELENKEKPTSNTNSMHMKSAVSLPTIKLPTFDGSVENWNAFWSLFSTIIDQEDLPPVKKLNYLRVSLTGKAANAIESLDLTDANYPVAIAILKDKYESLRRMTRQHYSILRKYPKLQRDSATAISELVDTFHQHTRALENLKAPVSYWDIPLVDLILSKLNENTVWQWELTFSDDPNKIPSFKDLLKFLERRAICSMTSHNETVSNVSNKPSYPKYDHQQRRSVQALYTASNPSAELSDTQNATVTCPVCNEPHRLYTCDKFRNLTIDDRRKVITNGRLCFNCFGKGHGISNCKSKLSCQKCSKRHNTLLHLDYQSPRESTQETRGGLEQNESQSSKNICQSARPPSRQISFVINVPSNDIMVTAMVNIVDKNHQVIQCRGLLDTCSTTNFMTQRVADLLGLKSTSCRIPIGALNAMTTYCNKMITATIKSRVNGYTKTLTFLIVPTISHIVPDQSIPRELMKIPSNIKLADPTFDKPAPIDILIGAGTTLSLLSIGQIRLSAPGEQELYAQKTLLGWVIGGSPPTRKGTTPQHCYATNTATFDEFDLEKFWKIEECPSTKKFTTEEEECEKHFSNHVSRDQRGRYIVALPFNPLGSKLGNSHHMALKRFENSERKLKRNPVLQSQYNNVLREYLDLNHMSPVQTDPSSSDGYYLPHHAVIKESSMTTKLRVVFDGSAKTTNGTSLNDILLTGPTIQSDLFSLLIRFRKHPIVITGDIEKMYRQFLVRKEDRKFQRIIWKNEKNEVQTYELNTVTFGLAPAPYLAIRCLHQLAIDEGHLYPRAAQILQEDFYVDDLLTGAQNTVEATEIQQEMTQILDRAGLSIRQWASNDHAVLKNIPEADINRQLQLGDTTIKTLGVFWESSTDNMCFTVKPILMHKITKRTILSEIAKIFDPLGLLAPVIIIAKIILQRLWTEKLDWDETLPLELHTEWTKYCEQLPSLTQMSFPRTIVTPNYKNIQLHGFSDASEKAYGACIYLRLIDHHDIVNLQLLCAKSRVAPVKTVTIPRLELCGAHLLSSLTEITLKALKLEIKEVFYWTDSTIVLHWLNTSPQQLKTFVSNRVASIQRKTDIKNWYHISTKDNPADLVSRGLRPAEFITAAIWKNGPPWLTQPQFSWPSTIAPTITDLPEQRRQICCITTIEKFDIFHRFSSRDRLIRSLAYCLRFRHKGQPRGPLTVQELTQVEKVILRSVQNESFSTEIKKLKDSQPLDMKSSLLKLNPKIDEDGILRVGGRLSFSNLPHDAKHPIILPKNHHVTNLFITHAHITHLHTGVQQTLYILRRKYWIPDGRSQVHKIIKQCIKCYKVKPPSTNYIMGDLPKARITPSPPFSQVGIDYCGPFMLKEKKFRNKQQIKAYVVVFVCMAVKAVHLELVTDLTTDGFLSTLRRFISRRGLPRDLFSDNGTNFIGANNHLKTLANDLKDSKAQQQIHEYLSSKGIQWHFIPPHAPHIGGLWEAAVKSFKKHLHHVAGLNMLFTYEQFNTLIIEIEAILNSRPLTPISNDPTDPLVLTPGHFLIGDSLTNLRGRDYLDVPANRLSTWEHIQRVKQDFWKRWSREYLNELTVRTKWTKPGPEFTTGALVLLKEDHLPPAQWAMGRIMECYPGTDGIIRTVRVKTANSSLVRNVKKVALLPISKYDSNQ